MDGRRLADSATGSGRVVEVNLSTDETVKLGVNREDA
jgi:hypothetical protein